MKRKTQYLTQDHISYIKPKLYDELSLEVKKEKLATKLQNLGLEVTRKLSTRFDIHGLKIV